MRKTTLRAASLLVVVSALAAVPKPAQAGVFTFVGSYNSDWNYLLNGSYANWLNGQIHTGSSYEDEIHLGLSTAMSRLASNMNFSSTRLGKLSFDQGGGVDLTGNAIRFGGGGSIAVTSAVAHTMTNAVVLNDNAATGNTLTVDVVTNGSLAASGLWSGAGSVVKTGAGTLTLSGANAYSGGTTIQGGRLVVAQPGGDYRNDATLEVANADAQALSGVVSGTGAFVKSGTGVLTLSGTNTYTGGTTIRGGTVKLGNDKGIGTNGDLTLVGGTLDLNGHSSTVKNLTFGDGTLTGVLGTVGGSGTLVLSGNVALRNQRSSPTVVVGANLSLLAGQHVFSSANSNGSRYNDVYSGTISGEGGIDKTGPGWTVFTGRNTYQGATKISEGILFLGTENALPTTTALTLDAWGELIMDPFAATGVTRGSYSQTVGSVAGQGWISLGSATLTVGSLGTDTTFSGFIAGVGGKLVKVGAGTLNLDLAFSSYEGTNLYNGGTTIQGGRLIVNRPSGAYQNDAILEIANADAQAISGAVSGTGALVKSGAGTLTLSGLNTYAGGTTIQNGTLALAGPIALPVYGSVAVGAAGALTMNGYNAAMSALTGTGSVSTGGGTLLVGAANADFAFGGKLSGGGLLNKVGDGRADLSGANLAGFSGSVRVEGGTLAATTAVTGAVSLSGGAYEIAQNSSGFLMSAITGTGGLIKSGTGTVLALAPASFAGWTSIGGGSLVYGAAGTLNGDLTVASGATLGNLSGGTLTIAGRTVNQGEIATTGAATTVFKGLVSGKGAFTGLGAVDFQGGYNPGNSPASVSFEGDLKLSSSLQMELGGLALGTGYDHLDVAGTAFLGGALDVVWYGGFAATQGQSFDLFDFKSSNGAFSSISLPTLANGLRWNTSSLYADGTISVQAVPEPATWLAMGAGAAVLMRRRKRQGAK